MNRNTFDLLVQPAESAAPRLLGCEIVREIDGEILRGKIVETEAYDQTDAASHSYRGRTARTEPMFGPAGLAYVYFTYGMHYCMNIVVGASGYGAAVLIRALEPLEGLEIMATNRGFFDLAQASRLDAGQGGREQRSAAYMKYGKRAAERATQSSAKNANSAASSASRQVGMTRSLCNGPAKLTQALAVDKSFSGHNLAESPLSLIIKPPLAPSEIVRTSRIGISREQAKQWRFHVKDNKFVSRASSA